MSETFGGNYESTQSVEGNNEQIISSLSEGKKDIQDKVTDFYLKNKDDEGSVQGLKDLLQYQYQEQDRSSLSEQIKENTTIETIDELDKEALINEARISLYEKLGLDNNLEANSTLKKFLKGFVDEAVIGNYDLAVEVYNTGGEVILNSLKQLATLEGLKQIAVALGESVWDLLSGDAYERGKALAELGLVATGVGVSVTVGKKGVKLGMKQISKLRANKENLVSSPDLKEVVSEVSNKVDEIVPKKELDFEKLVKDDIIRIRKEKEVSGKEDLMDGKVKENVSNNSTLYDKKEYEFLSEYRDILGDIREADIVGEGLNGIILKHSKSHKVIKIAKPGNTDKLDIEFSNHTEFRDKLIELKDNLKGTERGEILDNIYIAKVNRYSEKNGIYEMDMIEGHTLKTKETLKYHKKELADLSDNYFDNMTDNEVDLFLKDRGLTTYPKTSIDENKMWSKQEGIDFMVDLERAGDNRIRDEIKPALDILKEKGYIHNDEHWGNFMEGNDGKIYIIDFGRSKIPNNN